MAKEKLTEEQIKNWRMILSMQYGVPPHVFTEDQIYKMRDNLQDIFDENEEKDSLPEN